MGDPGDYIEVGNNQDDKLTLELLTGKTNDEYDTDGVWIDPDNDGVYDVPATFEDTILCLDVSDWSAFNVSARLYSEGPYPYYFCPSKLEIAHRITIPIVSSGKTTLIEPDGAIGTCPTFTWKAIDGISWYRLYVRKENTSDKIIDQWYKTETVCDDERCKVFFPVKNGNYEWWVETYNDYGYRVWSDAGLSFSTNGCCADSGQPPATLAPATPNGDIEVCCPVFTWDDDPCVQWVRLWVGSNASGAWVEEHDQWYEIGVDATCSQGTCTVKPEFGLDNGNYSWFIQPWNPSGYGEWSSETPFTINHACCAPPAAVTQIEPSGAISDPMPAYVWEENSCAEWYRLWIGDAAMKAVFDKWYQVGIDVICDDGECDVIPPVSLKNGSYSWYIRPWNSYDYGDWSDGMVFTLQD